MKIINNLSCIAFLLIAPKYCKDEPDDRDCFSAFFALIDTQSAGHIHLVEVRLKKKTLLDIYIPVYEMDCELVIVFRRNTWRCVTALANEFDDFGSCSQTLPYCPPFADKYYDHLPLLYLRGQRVTMKRKIRLVKGVLRWLPYRDK